MTRLETRMYVALMGARTIIAATANVNPRAIRMKLLIDQVCATYKEQEAREAESPAAEGETHAA